MFVDVVRGTILIATFPPAAVHPENTVPEAPSPIFSNLVYSKEGSALEIRWSAQSGMIRPQEGKKVNKTQKNDDTQIRGAQHRQVLVRGK